MLGKKKKRNRRNRKKRKQRDREAAQYLARIEQARLQEVARELLVKDVKIEWQFEGF